jgi:hypothetical protein
MLGVNVSVHEFGDSILSVAAVSASVSREPDLDRPPLLSPPLSPQTALRRQKKEMENWFSVLNTILFKS